MDFDLLRDFSSIVDGESPQLQLGSGRGWMKVQWQVNFDRRVRLEFRSTQLSSDGGLLAMRELDDALGLSDLTACALTDTRKGVNKMRHLDDLFRQSVYGRLACYEDANQLAFDQKTSTNVS